MKCKEGTLHQYKELYEVVKQVNTIAIFIILSVIYYNKANRYSRNKIILKY